MGRLRIWLEDGSWATVEVTNEATAAEIVEIVGSKRQVDVRDAGLFVVVDGDGTPMPMKGQECPLELFNIARTNGKTLRFVLGHAEVPALDIQENMWRPGDDCVEPHHDSTLSRAADFLWNGKVDLYGYLDKTGEMNSAWRSRFFILIGCQLCYYKTHTHKKPIKKIDLRQAVVRDTSTNTEFSFSLLLEKRAFHLRCSSRYEQERWVTAIHKQSLIVRYENHELDYLQLKAESWSEAQGLAQEERVLSIETIHGFLQVAEAIPYYYRFLEKTHAEENLGFVIAVLEYRKLAGDQTQRRDKAIEIFNLFIRRGSLREISVENKVRGSLEERMLLPDPRCAIFDAVYDQVVLLLESSSFEDFKASPYFVAAQVEAMKQVSVPEPTFSKESVGISTVWASPRFNATQSFNLDSSMKALLL